jgi:hypothetical protein
MSQIKTMKGYSEDPITSVDLETNDTGAYTGQRWRQLDSTVARHGPRQSSSAMGSSAWETMGIGSKQRGDYTELT